MREVLVSTENWREQYDIEEGRMLSYTHEPFVYLETADRRIFAEPYGPYCPTAVGKVFTKEPIQGGEHAAAHVSFVEVISPQIFHPRIGDCMRIGVEREEVNHGKRTLHATVFSTEDGSGRPDSGARIVITLFER